MKDIDMVRENRTRFATVKAFAVTPLGSASSSLVKLEKKNQTQREKNRARHAS